MPYAGNGQISTSKFDGAVEITQAEYDAAIEGMLGGKLVTVDGGFSVVDPPKPEEPPVPEPLTPAEALEAWRDIAVASQAQIRLTHHYLGLAETVQATADADPAASIVWEYADEIRRRSPFIDGLKADKFTDPQIDDIFRYAMALKF